MPVAVGDRLLGSQKVNTSKPSETLTTACINLENATLQLEGELRARVKEDGKTLKFLPEFRVMRKHLSDLLAVQRSLKKQGV